MTNFSYNDAVPATNNSPSVDQPDMLINTESNSNIWNEDHIGMNVNNGGTHQFMRMFNDPNYIAPTPLGTPNGAVYWSSAGVAATAAAAKFTNSQLTFPLNLIRAWAFCTPGGYDPSQQFNAGTISRVIKGMYSVTLPANVVTGTIFSIQLGFTQIASPNTDTNVTTGNYNITGAGTFDIFFKDNNGSARDPFSFSFIVLQL